MPNRSFAFPQSKVMSREDRITELKQRMVAKYGSCLLPIAEDTATFPEFRKDDTPEEKEIKLQKKRDIIAAREALYKQKVPEMMIELEKLIDRVKSARPELVKSGMENIYSTGTAALTVFNLACDQCGNRDPNYLVTDSRRGDRICLGKDGRGCGAVVQDHIEVQGADRRNFEGEDDRRQFGPAPNKLLGDSANMETSLNIEMKGTGRENAPWKRISQAHQNVEMSLSNVGKDEKHTREGYKTAHKRRAFAQLEVIASDMNIHMQVVQKAKEEFAKYREVREALHNFEGVLLACLALAFEELSPHLQFMSEKPKFTTIADSESTADVTFGKVRPRQEVTEDIAICAVPSVAMGKFTLEQVKEWLISVSQSDSNSSSGDKSSENSVNYETEALIVYDYIAKLSNGGTASTTTTTNNTATSAKNKVELPKSSIFGSVTVSSRLKMYGNKGTTNGSTSSNNEAVVLRAGQHLLRVNNIATALHAAQNTTSSANSTTDGSISTTTDNITTTLAHSKAAELLFREAVIRRSQYDASLLEYERVTSLQNTRMRIEDQASTNFQASVLQLGKHKNNPTSSSTSSVKVEGGSAVSEKRSFAAEETTSSGDHAAKRIKTEPASNATNNTSTVSVSPEDSSDFADFDLEDLVGGPVASANASKYANIKTVAATTNTSGSRPVVPKIATTNTSSNGNHVNSNNSNGVTIKQEGEGSSAHNATETKKVGSRPRPKFVIS